MPKSILYHRHVQICAALIVADIAVFTLVDPVRANAVWLIAGYILLATTLFALASMLAQTVKSYGERTYKIAGRLLRYATVAAVLLVGLQSIGQLTTKDILTFAPFIIIAYWYFGYSKRPNAALALNK